MTFESSRAARADRTSLGWTNLILIIALILLISVVLRADEPLSAGTETELAQLSLEQLMKVEIEVTSVSKKAEKLSDATSAVYVLTSEDIRRSGATNIAEALRMVPGMYVSRINASAWMVNARGLGDRFANKLLVMVDGRSVYSPMFSGVEWDVQDTLLENIDRIEIIRGPAPTWGANAVNGVVNIISKTARQTQERLMTTSVGGEEREVSNLQYGAAMGPGSYYRVYGKSIRRSGFMATTGQDDSDAWTQSRVGFRSDSELNNGVSLTVQGETYSGDATQVFEGAHVGLVEGTTDANGGHLMARWNKSASPTSQMSLQMYYDETNREDWRESDKASTWDLDFQHHYAAGSRQDIVWGVGYRYGTDQIASDTMMALDPVSRTKHLLSAFVQDDIQIKPDKMRLTLGSRFEHNSATGLEIQPCVRLLMKPNEHHTIWASISRAVRTPCRFERDSRVVLGSLPRTLATGGMDQEIVLIGKENMEAEKVISYEAGYRAFPSRRLSVDATMFYSRYNDFRSFEQDPAGITVDPERGVVVVPMQIDNKMNARTYGLELSTDYRVSNRWRVSAGYSLLRVKMTPDATSTDTLSSYLEDLNPKSMCHLRSYLDLSDTMQFDVMLYGVGRVKNPTIVSSTPDSPGYARLDLRLGWHVKQDMDFDLVLQNALQSEHQEYDIMLSEVGIPIERSLYGRLIWRF